jgi:hypothetical protein
MNILRSFLYWLARLIGDLNAISRGPAAVNRRIRRRIAGKLAGRLFRRL